MDIKYFIGVDVSQDTLDFALVMNGKVVSHMQDENSINGIKRFIKVITRDYSFDQKCALFCMEHTGVYNNILLKYLTNSNARIWLESSLQISRSQGILRGKNDKVDSQRIALYAYKNQAYAKMWVPSRTIIIELKHLIGIRNRLIQAVCKLQTPIKSSRAFLSPSEMRSMESSCKSSLMTLKKDIKNIEKKMKQLIVQDEQLSRQYKILTSISGIGIITAIELITVTDEFKKFPNAKKFACYAGVVPFEHRSGTSIRGKSRVSPMANKSIKKLLHIAVLTGIRTKGEFRNYYVRKNEQGKHKMSVINAIRNKIVLRIFACIREDRLYKKLKPDEANK